MKTTIVKPEAPKWILIDAEGQSLGRLAASTASILRGKHKPSFSPHQIYGDHVVVINASKLSFQSAKLHRKQYARHTGFIGSLKVISLGDLFKQNPVQVIEKAVKGMLPKNKLRNEMMKRLHVYAESEHNHGAQKPQPLTSSPSTDSTSSRQASSGQASNN